MTITRAFYCLVGVLAGGLFGWFSIRQVDWAAAQGSLGRLDWRIVLMALGALGFAWFLEAYRWKLLLPGEKVSLRRLFLVRHAGVGLNNISPVRLLAELTQTAMLTHTDRIRAPKVASSIALARLFDLLVTINLVGVGLVVLPQLAGFRPVVVPLWGLTAVALLAFLIFGRRLYRFPAVRRIRFVGETLRSISATRTRLGVLLACVSVTALSWMSIGLGAWLVAQASGITLPFWLISVVIVAIMLFASTVPAPPGVVGVYEFVAVSTLGLFAVDAGAALTFALVTHALIFIPPLLIAIPVLALERRTLGVLASVAVRVIEKRRR